MAQMTLTAVYMKVPEGYVGFVEELPGANTQGETLEEVRANLRGSHDGSGCEPRVIGEVDRGSRGHRETLIP